MTTTLQRTRRFKEPQKWKEPHRAGGPDIKADQAAAMLGYDYRRLHQLVNIGPELNGVPGYVNLSQSDIDKIAGKRPDLAAKLHVGWNRKTQELRPVLGQKREVFFYQVDIERWIENNPKPEARTSPTDYSVQERDRVLQLASSVPMDDFSRVKVWKLYQEGQGKKVGYGRDYARFKQILDDFSFPKSQ